MTAPERGRSEFGLRRAEAVTAAVRFGTLLLLAWGAMASRQSLVRVEQSHQIIGALESIERLGLNAQVSARDFAQTRDPATWDAITAIHARRDSTLRVLQKLTAGDSAQRARTTQLLSGFRAISLHNPRPSPTVRISPDSTRRILNDPARLAARKAIIEQLAQMIKAEQQTLFVQTQTQHRADLFVLLCAAAAVIISAAISALTRRTRRQMATALQRSEESFRVLASASPDGVFVHVDGHIVYMNDAAAAMMHATPETMIGRPAMSILHPDDRDVVRSRKASIEQTGMPSQARLLRYLRDDGGICEAEARGASIVFEGKQAFQVVMRDLTARRADARALEASEQRLRTVLDAMGEGIVFQNADLGIELWNPAAETILGLTANQMAGRSSYDPDWMAIDEHGRALAPEEHYSAIAIRTGSPAKGPMGVQRPGQGRVWINVHAIPLYSAGQMRPFGVVVTFADVSAEREVTDRLRDSEARYRLLAEFSADMVTRRNRDNVITYASPAHKSILGWDPDEMLGCPASEFMHPDDMDRVVAARGRAAENGESANIIARVRHRDGYYLPLEMVTVFLRTPDGEPDGLLVCARDVSARLALAEQLRQSQKMEVMGRMASGVAHDFNNLLTVIRSSCELLRLDLEGSTVDFDSLRDIEYAADRAVALTSHLLTFSRREHASMEHLQPGDVLRGALPILKRLGGKSIDVSLEISPEIDDAWMWTNPTHAQQILLNLVSNARDAMPDGGTIEITCASVALQNAVTHRFGVIQPGRYITITVSDSGVGMTDDVLANLFDPFYTTKPQGRGTGLGLSIVYGIVTEAQGTITISSEPGAGSRFTVYWPRAEAPADVPPLTTSEDPDAMVNATSTEPIADDAAASAARNAVDRHPDVTIENGGAITILLVDDDDAVRRVIAKQLHIGGYRVLEAESGQRALEMYHAHDAQIHAVVSDVRMPGMTGVELARSMAANGIFLPILLVSGQLETQLPASWPDGAIVHFLPKPITGATLRRKVSDMLAETTVSQP